MQPRIFFLYLGLLFGYSSSTDVLRNRNVDYFLQRSGIHEIPFNLNEARNGRMMVTNLDNFRGLFVLGRLLLLAQAETNWGQIYKDSWDNGKVQVPRPKWEKFPCRLNNTRSLNPPKTVHELRPGDIDVIGALGDSLSAGNGLMSNSLIHTGTEFRGLAFSGGGVADWRTVLTLPNILKVFNPNLYGYSTGEVLTVDRGSHLNIAEPMVLSRDLVFQAEIIIARMKNDPRIDMKNHWKLLTIFLGNNDICSDMCHHDNFVDFLRKHEHDLRNAFRLLRDSVPRLIINLIPVPNMVTTLYELKNIPFTCHAVHSIGCHCVFSQRFDARYMRTISERIARWQAVDEYVSELPEFRTDDFVVIYQPFTANVSTPYLPNGDSDMRYFGTDCFHFSQLGHAAMANGLWNSMMQVKGQKQVEFFEPFENFQCPTEERPFIATWKNSRSS